MNNAFKRGFGCLLLLLGATTGTYAADGQVISVAGDVSVERYGKRVTLRPGDAVLSRDTVNTGENSIVRFRMSDDSYFALPANSSLRINDYLLPGKAAAKTTRPRAVFSLLKGGFRTVTGLIGKLGRDAYQVRTPVATIGVRGTEYSVYFCAPGGCTGDLSTKVSGVFGADSSWQVAALEGTAFELAANPGPGVLTVEVISGTVTSNSPSDNGGPNVITLIAAGQTMTVDSLATPSLVLSGERAPIFAATLINDFVFNPENPIDLPSTLESSRRLAPLDERDTLESLSPPLPIAPRLEPPTSSDPPASPS